LPGLPLKKRAQKAAPAGLQGKLGRNRNLARYLLCNFWRDCATKRRPRKNKAQFAIDSRASFGKN